MDCVTSPSTTTATATSLRAACIEIGLFTRLIENEKGIPAENVPRIICAVSTVPLNEEYPAAS
jgi:hypothetical protein